jgi:hypothetical protein
MPLFIRVAKAFLFLSLSVGPSLRSALSTDYMTEIKPLLEHKCYACHGALKQQASLRLDTAQFLLQGGESGPVVMANRSDQSLLIQVVSGHNGVRMPPENEGSPLTEDEINRLRRWIDSGAIAPEKEEPQSDPRSWWSYQPIIRPLANRVSETAHDPTSPFPESTFEESRNPIDDFVQEVRQSHQLKSVREAPKSQWLRRVTLDLIGLPPTHDELQRFMADEGHDAYERVVDELLTRPQYGERWGRHWMDIWRYSDWYGSRTINEIRYSQRHIWRWRDWIIQSLNDDKSYAQMIREMLAADELVPQQSDLLPATGFLGRNWYKFDRDVWLFETTERTAEAFLAVTMRCARCHDHKYDPIEQTEYYRWRAFFEPHDVRTDPVSILTPLEKDATLGMVPADGIARIYDAKLETPTYVFARGDNRFPQKETPLQPGFPQSLGNASCSIDPIPLPLEAWYPALRPEIRASHLAKAEQSVVKAKECRMRRNAYRRPNNRNRFQNRCASLAP